MKKIVITAMVALAGMLPSAAQSVSLDSGDKTSYFGIRVGGDVLCPGDVESGKVKTDMFKTGGGIEVGGIYNQPILMNFYIEPGLSFFYNAYGIDKEILRLADPDAKSGSIRRFGIRIPVLAGYHFDFSDDLKVHVVTGPELEIGFYGQECVNYKHSQYREDMYVSSSENEMAYNRCNFLWDFGAGVTWKQYYFGFKGGIGMTNMLKAKGVKLHENRVQFTVGYNF